MAYCDIKKEDILGLGYDIKFENWLEIRNKKISEYVESMIDMVIAGSVAFDTEEDRRVNIIYPLLKEFEYNTLIVLNLNILYDKQLISNPHEGFDGISDIIVGKRDVVGISMPIIIVKTVKTDNLFSWTPQCMSSMVTAKVKNESDGINRDMYGVVTDGIQWLFIKLSDKTFYINQKRLFHNRPKEIIGTFDHLVNLFMGAFEK